MPAVKPKVAPKKLATKPVPAPKVKPPVEEPLPTVAEAVEAQKREVVYQQYEVQLACSSADGGVGPLDYETVKQLLGWETEAEYAARRCAANPLLKPENCKFKDDDWAYMGLFDIDGETKVMCWNNANNRPFDVSHADKLGLEILNKHWKLNGETVIIGRTGLVESGQHRLVGFIRAVHRWRDKNEQDHWLAIWPEEPTFETVVFFGAHEDQETIATLDNGKTRTLSDTLATSDLYAGCKPVERKQKARCMDSCIDLFWKRTGAGDLWEKFQTHSASADLLKRHPRLIDCVNFIYDRNKAHQFNHPYKIQPGHCAAMLYLMGSCSSDIDVYRNTSPRSEEVLSWDYWDKACAFFDMLVWYDKETDKVAPESEALRKAMTDLIDLEEGMGGRITERLAMLCKAWNLYLQDQPITAEGLALEYGKKGDTIGLLDIPTVGGIDDGGDRALTPEEIEEVEVSKVEVRKKKAQEAVEKVKKGSSRNGTPAPQVNELELELDNIRAKHPGRLLLFKRGTGYGAWGKDAMTLSQTCKMAPPETVNGLPFTNFLGVRLNTVLETLHKAKVKVAVCDSSNGHAAENVIYPGPDGKLPNGHKKK